MDNLHTYDPVRHDSQLIGLFADEASAGLARSAVLEAGVPAERILTMADGAALHGGVRHPVQDLFVPEDDYHDYHHALGRGHVLLIVQPGSPDERAAAAAALERAAPLSLEQHGRKWRGTAGPVPRLEINHANLSRADMHGRAIGGRDEVILDMTGQKMLVRMMSEADMAEAPFAPMATPEQRPAPLAPPPPARDVPVSGTSYTYGVPIDVVQRMSPAEQVLAQPHGTFLRVMNGQTRVGWRDHHPDTMRVRSYVTERSIDPAS